jgi:hypothetical protein
MTQEEFIPVAGDMVASRSKALRFAVKMWRCWVFVVLREEQINTELGGGTECVATRPSNNES